MGENKALEYKLAATSSKEARVSLFFSAVLVSRDSHRALLGRCTLYLLSQAGRLSEGLTSRVPHRLHLLLRSPEEALKTNPIWGTMRRIYGKDKGEIYMKYPPLRYGRGAHKPGRGRRYHTKSHSSPFQQFAAACKNSPMTGCLYKEVRVAEYIYY